MIYKLVLGLIVLMWIACSGDKKTSNLNEPGPSSLEGTWKLISASNIMNGDTTYTDYTKNIEGIKVINSTHFSFFQHDLKMGRDSMPVYTSGGGKYLLEGNRYTEYLEYCSAR